MDFYKVPIGFGMALAMNANALNAYSAMTEMQKQEILDKAHHARSEREMHEIVNSIINKYLGQGQFAPAVFLILGYSLVYKG